MPDGIAVAIGKRIRERRNALGLTQDDLAGRVGVSRGVLLRIEAGENVTAVALLRIADALDAPVEHFYGTETAAEADAQVKEATRCFRSLPPKLRDAALASLRAMARTARE